MKKIVGSKLASVLFASCFVVNAHASELVGIESVKLLADVDQVEVGGSLRLAVHFKLAPGWHIYWKNPGEAGVATQVDFQMPGEFIAGPLRWPTPEKFLQRRNIIGYGYSTEAFLSTVVNSAADQLEGRRVIFGAEARWLSCSPKRCVPGSVSLKVPVDVRMTRNSTNQKIFTLYENKLPLQKEAAAKLVEINSQGTLKSLGGRGVFDIYYKWKLPGVKVKEWIPVDFDGLSVDLLSLTTKNNTTHARFRAMLGPGSPLERSSLESHLVLDDQLGQESSVRYNIGLDKEKR